MKYSLEIPPVIRTGRSRIISPSALEEDKYAALREMICYKGFMQELVNDEAPQRLLVDCRNNYDTARTAAIALGIDVTNFPRHLRIPQQQMRLAA